MPNPSMTRALAAAFAVLAIALPMAAPAAAVVAQGGGNVPSAGGGGKDGHRQDPVRKPIAPPAANSSLTGTALTSMRRPKPAKSSLLQRDAKGRIKRRPHARKGGGQHPSGKGGTAIKPSSGRP